MNKFDLKSILLGIILSFSICVCATILYNAREIEFNPADENWNVNNIEEAINDIKNNYYSSTDVKNLLQNINSWNYSYTGNYQEFEVPITGEYKIELWGASGGQGCGSLTSSSSYSCQNGAAGGYASGNIKLTSGEKIYLYVGNQPQNNLDTTTVYTAGGWNGGGNGIIASDKDDRGTGGGGATDVRIINGNWNDYDSLKSRIMVAGGGGGSIVQANTFETVTSGYGGGLTAVGTIYAYSAYALGTSANATQTTGYSFGIGEDGYSTGDTEGAAGGGGGYYGGKNGKSMTTNAAYYGSGAGGGSGFISGHSGCDAIDENGNHTGQPNHYSGKIFTNTVLKAGNESMPTYNGKSTMVGNSGNGYAKITLVSID